MVVCLFWPKTCVRRIKYDTLCLLNAQSFVLQRVFTRGESGEDAVFQQIGGSARQSQLFVSHSEFFSFFLFLVSIIRSSQVLLDVTSISQDPGEVPERSRSRDSSLHHASITDWQAAQPVTVTLGETPRPLTLHVSFPIGQETDSPAFSSRQEASEWSQRREASESFGWVENTFLRRKVKIFLFIFFFFGQKKGIRL